MAQLVLPKVKVASVEFIADGIAFPLSSATRRIAGKSLPEHCRVNGNIVAGPDATGAALDIAFEIRLPSQWNGRFFGQGTANAQDQLVEAFGRNSGAGGLENNALSRGFAVLASTPWRVAGGAAADRPQRRDAAAVALERSGLTAKALIQAYYGRPPDRSYFIGCAEGGRDGLRFAQHWPSMFDGIVAVAPKLREADAALAATWTLGRFTAVAPRGSNRHPVLSRALSTQDLFTVAQGVLKQCDALDGAEDGFVMDMASCRFDPGPLQCKRGKSKECLPANKLQALREAMAGPRDAAGQALYAPWPWDPGIAAPGWRAWTLGQAGPGSAPDARHLTRTSIALGAEFVTPPDPKLNALNFDFKRDLPRVQAARDADAAFFALPLEAFRQRQGRLLLVHGAADPVVSAWATVAYQQRLSRSTEGAGAREDVDFVRAFIVPGMNHCAGGPSTDRFDALAAMVDWVETDKPPQRIEARGSDVLHDETRPLCPWPEVAHYIGSGSLHESASYACR